MPAQAQVASIDPVTDAELQDPSPDEWLMWRRTLNGWGYSPLDQVNRDNVAGLRMVWSRGLGPGRQQGTPLVRNGVMYMPNPRDLIQALDAVTGDLLWQYQRDRPDDLADYLIPGLIDHNRNIAIYDTLIFDSTTDDYVIALDATTGEVVLGDRGPRLPGEPGESDIRSHRRRRQGDLGAELRSARRAARLRHRRPRRADR